MLSTLSKEFGRKVKTVEELCRIVGPRPRDRTIVMCHGVFDLVHPGHIRHLVYAKGKADLLVVSITGDAHVTKTPHRPFVPQSLRALNLAALEMVDYVIIDDQPTPLRNLAQLQPDFYAKGYEYVNAGLRPKTQEEMEILQSYGGEILFTPGDIVYSSSAIIEAGPPDLAVEKLLVLMEAEGITFEGLRDALAKFEGVTVHVVGDTIVDSLTHTTMIGGMTKTPTPSVRLDNRVDYVGGAAIVADAAADRIAAQIATTPARAVVFSDFRHGVFNRRTVPRLTAAIPQGVFRVADSQVASRWGNILDFKGFDLITPNEREARFSLADQDTGVRPLAAQIHGAAECKVLILKLGDRGVLTCRSRDYVDYRSFFVIDSFAEKVVDSVGAGDALLAYATLAMVTTGSDVVASILGTFAAAHECEVEGNLPIGTADILRKIDAVERLARYEESARGERPPR